MSVVRFTHGKASAKLVFLAEGLFHLGDVWTDTDARGQGYAKGVMRKVVDYADKNHITILLKAQRYGKVTDPALDNHELEAFYSRFGFEITDHAPVKMIRRPRTPYTAFNETPTKGLK